MTLPTRSLGTSGLNITGIGFGAWAIGGGGWSFGWGPQDDAASLAAMRHALELGINSSRPSLPRLIVALLFAAVATTLSEKIVAPEIAACPLTVT